MYALSIIAIIAASQGFALAIVLYTHPVGLRIANQILAVFIAVLSVRLSVHYLIYADFIQHCPRLMILLTLNLTLGPLLFCYVKALAMESYSWNRTETIHFLPAALLVSFAILMSFLPGGTDTAYLWWTGSFILAASFLGDLIIVAAAVYIFSYITAAGYRLRKHQHQILKHFSNVDDKTLNWIWVVIILSILIPLTTVIEQLLIYHAGHSFESRQIQVTLITAILVYFLAYMGMRQKVIFAPCHASEIPASNAVFELAEIPDASGADKSLKPVKYLRGGLKETQLAPLWNKLELLMAQQQPFLEEDLKLGDLAQLVDLSPHHLSQLINRMSGHNFFDYINEYRVKKAAMLLEAGSDQSLSAIALEAGFSSQQAFSTRFKKVMRRTPSQYRKEHKTPTVQK